MCKYCGNVKLSQCRVLVEGETGIRNIKGELEYMSCFSDMLIPLNFCPACGRKLGECDD